MAHSTCHYNPEYDIFTPQDLSLSWRVTAAPITPSPTSKSGAHSGSIYDARAFDSNTRRVWQRYCQEGSGGGAEGECESVEVTHEMWEAPVHWGGVSPDELVDAGVHVCVCGWVGG